ncbi:MAG: hypothetical protein IJZ00_09195 [Lachnospiraceae bacterium]|nr:hypothetical protein [Lachnospiraceae bacterium]
MGKMYCWLDRGKSETVENYDNRINQMPGFHAGYAFFHPVNYNAADHVFAVYMVWNGEFNAVLQDSMPQGGYVVHCSCKEAASLSEGWTGLPVYAKVVSKDGRIYIKEILLDYNEKHFVISYNGCDVVPPEEICFWDLGNVNAFFAPKPVDSAGSFYRLQGSGKYLLGSYRGLRGSGRLRWQFGSGMGLGLGNGFGYGSGKTFLGSYRKMQGSGKYLLGSGFGLGYGLGYGYGSSRYLLGSFRGLHGSGGMRRQFGFGLGSGFGYGFGFGYGYGSGRYLLGSGLGLGNGFGYGYGSGRYLFGSYRDVQSSGGMHRHFGFGSGFSLGSGSGLGSGFGIGSAGRNSGLATSARMLSVSDAKEYETYLLELKLIQEIFGIGSLGYGLNLI